MSTGAVRPVYAIAKRVPTVRKSGRSSFRPGYTGTLQTILVGHYLLACCHNLVNRSCVNTTGKLWFESEDKMASVKGRVLCCICIFRTPSSISIKIVDGFKPWVELLFLRIISQRLFSHRCHIEGRL